MAKSMDAGAKGRAMKAAIEERIAANQKAYDEAFGELVLPAAERIKREADKPPKAKRDA
jgi:hypothetical protein